MILMIGLWTFLRAIVTDSAALALENMALRHQLTVLQRSGRRPRLARRDRIFWLWLSRVWTNWRSSLVIIQPATVVAWHRQGFQLYWRWKSRANPVGRPRLDAEIRHLIRRVARDNPTWGRRRIQHMGTRQLVMAPRAPWQDPFVERVIGSIRRECLDHVVVLNERHLHRLLRAYLAYYNAVRPHQALGHNSPHPRPVQPPARGRVIAIPQLGGLHHRYERAA